MEDMKVIHIRLPKDVHKRMRLYCLEKDVSMQEVVAEWIEECLKVEEEEMQ